ncbi:MAG: thermonuclease family protein [Myxococcota bacterium]
MTQKHTPRWSAKLSSFWLALVPFVLSTAVRAEQPSRVYLNGVAAPVFFNDGDSFRVLEGPLKGTKARLAGFNTLESFGPVHQWGTWTYKELSVLSKMATYNARRGVWHCDSDLSRDSYGRILWHCKDLAADQVRKGLAHAMSVTSEPAEAYLLEAQREAIANRRGMWAHGVPSLLLTSLHSVSEGGGKDGRTYNRVVSTVDGHSEPWLHKDHYGECQAVCAKVRRISNEEADRVVAALMTDEEWHRDLEGLSTDEKRRLFESFLSHEISYKDTPRSTRMKETLQRLEKEGALKPQAPVDDSCHIYVDFRRRFGGGKAVCLR